MAYRHILDRHAEEASELWVLRAAAAFAPHYRAVELARLDERVQANLDGLRLAGASGTSAVNALALEDRGAAFARAAIALERRDAKSLAQVLDAAADIPHLPQEIAGAFAWVPLDKARWAIDAMLRGQSPAALKRIALDACVAHREDPGLPLVDALGATVAPLRASALRGAGIMAKEPLLDVIRPETASPNARVGHAARMSAALLGDAQSGRDLWRDVRGAEPVDREALVIAIVNTPPAEAKDRVLVWLEDAERRRAGIVAAGILGVGAAIDPLLALLEDPAHHRVAAEAICRMTGLVVRGKLAGAAPEGFTAGANENPEDESVALDPDARLPWANTSKLAAAVKQRRPPETARSLWGRPVDGEVLADAFAKGSQRLRHEIAFERAAASAGAPVESTTLPNTARARRAAAKAVKA